MSRHTDIIFNVIFVPGSVQLLSPLMLSFLDTGPGYSIRLVSNGCNTKEDETLRAISKKNQRFQFHKIATKRMLDHGAALTILQQMEASSVFAFMDSDIFATGDFLTELNWQPAQSAAMFSCPPVWGSQELTELPEGFGVLSGVYNRLHDGFCVGSSYFAMYDNQLLSDVMESTGIRFKKYFWKQLPQALQDELAGAGKQMILYDTGKLITILLQLRSGLPVQFRHCRYLEHIGGVSGTGLSRSHQSDGRTDQYRRIAANALRYLRPRLNVHPDWRRLSVDEEIRWVDARSSRRRNVCAFFSELMAGLALTGSQNTSFSLDDHDVINEVNRVASLLRELYPDWFRSIELTIREGRGDASTQHSASGNQSAV